MSYAQSGRCIAYELIARSQDLFYLLVDLLLDFRIQSQETEAE
jgi:hypothetical protein